MGGRTFRIPLIHDTPHASDHAEAPVAPYIEGRLRIRDETWDVPFLIDTGADFSAINPNLLPGHLGALYAQGAEPDLDVGGIGGAWPARVFRACSLVRSTGGAMDLKLDLPHVYLLAAYRHLTEEGEIEGRMQIPAGIETHGVHPLETGRWTQCEFPNLLGRDVLAANNARLEFDPLGESYLYIRLSEGRRESESLDCFLASGRSRGRR